MKKILASALLILFSINIQAQWYNRQFNVNDINDLSEKQLNFSLQKANTNIKTGKILTFTGLGIGVIGFMVAGHGTTSMILEPLDKIENNLNEFAAGSVLMLAGMGAMAVGIPFWVVGANRRNKIEIALIKFRYSSFITFDNSEILGNKPPANFGLSMKLNF